MTTYVVMPHFIATKELEQLSRNAIESFRKTSACILISVDDGSPMDTSYLKEISDVYIRNEVNFGFAVTCNKGIRWVMENEKEDCYIVCANNDIEVFDGWEDALIGQFEYGNVAFAGLVSNKERVIDGVPIERYSRQKETEGGLLDDWMQSGGLWMSTKSVLEKIGLFDEQFLRGGLEDVDIFLRARDTFGMRIVMSAKSMFWHKEGATRWNTDKNEHLDGSFGKESKEIENDNLQKFIQKWGYNPWTRSLWKQIELFNNV